VNVEIWKDPISWDAYVGSREDAVNYHRWVWQHVIHDTYGHEPYYLAATAGGKIEGVLPLVCIRSLVFGHALVSLPFFSYGGLLANSEEAREALLEKAVQLARALRCKRVELRDGVAPEGDWRSVASKVTMGIDLSPGADQLFSNLNAKLRKRIRYATKHGLTHSWAGGEAVADFHHVFSINMRNLGTPVYPRSWFENIYRYSPGHTHLLTLLDEGKPVGAAFVHTYRDAMELPWAATLPEAREKFAPLLLYWSLIEWGCQRGYRHLDMGLV
jgi:serine/alanine adding enzyme